jgi:FAD:protein FMN transferase
VRARAVSLLAGVLLAACGSGETFRAERLLAMGTWVDLGLEAPDEATGARLVAEIETLLRGFERDYYAWSADGALARLNRGLAQGESVRVDPELAALLRDAQRYAAASGGTFEPAVGELVELWGFHSAEAAPTRPPDPASIEAWLRRDARISNLAIDETGSVSVARGEPMKVDLGAIAEGELVNRIIAILRAAGVENALVNVGGDLRVLGTRHGRPWRIGIQAPRARGVVGVVELASGEAAFTSGDYQRFFEFEGRRMHHIIDPSTGYPVTHTQAVTVITTDGVQADAAATALLVAGPGRWQAVAQALNVDKALRVDASGRVELTVPMRDRLQTGTEASSDIIVLGP